MTFLEKAMEIEKEKGSGMNIFQIMQKSCPSDYGFKDVECIKDGTAVVCMSCWNREMPNTEAKDELKERLELIDELKLVEYNKGLNDAWEFIKNLWNIVSDSVKLELFGTIFVTDILKNYTPQEALAKLKAYEEAQKIKVVVGDVVEITHCDEKFKGLVLDILDEISFVLLTENGMVESYVDERVKKTGKHIDIQSILESIGE